jgi:hypothetical protein
MTQFDWSEFHPLDHHILDRTCWHWAGGIPRHIELWWKYQFTADPPLWGRIQKRRCKQGLHDITAYYEKLPVFVHQFHRIETPADGLMCYRCDWSRKL